MNTGLEVMKNSLQSWSWQDIIDIYRILGKQLREYQGIAQRVNANWSLTQLRLKPGDTLQVKDAAEAEFVGRWFRDVQRIDAQLAVLDREINRRFQLVGNFR